MLKTTLQPKIAHTVDHKLGFGLVLTPQIKQRIEMLGMPHYELEQLIAQEIEKNPLLDHSEVEEGVDATDLEIEILNTDSDPLDTYIAQELEYTTTLEDTVSNSDPELEQNQDFSLDSSLNSLLISPPEFLQYLESGSRRYDTEESDENEHSNVWEQTVSNDITLQEHLLEQFRFLKTDTIIQKAGEIIISSLDSNGFLADSLKELSDFSGIPVKIFEEARRHISQLDPIGCAAFSAQESILIQMDLRGNVDRELRHFVEHCFSQLDPSRWRTFARETGLDVSTLTTIIEKLKKFSPKPAANFSTEKRTNTSIVYRQQNTISPEVRFVKNNQNWIPVFLEEYTPRFKLNLQYFQLMNQQTVSEEDRRYLKKCFQAAVDFSKNIDHRKKTILKICEAIGVIQADFFEKGLPALKPLMLKELAEHIHVHLSTVSRVVNSKWAETPHGVLELRRFFTEGLQNEAGDQVATQEVRNLICSFIKKEDPVAALTDDDLALLLEKHGIRISRRTVAKYREQMGLPGSRERRTLAEVIRET